MCVNVQKLAHLNFSVKAVYDFCQWSTRHTANFIKDPHPHLYQYALLDPILVIVRNEFKNISLNLSSSFCIVDVITRADRVIRTENILSRNRIRAQIYTVSRRLQNILRTCDRNITFRHPHLCCNTFVRCHTFALQSD